MSQNYRQDSRHSYNPRSYENQRDSNRSSYYHNSSYKEPQNYRSQRRDGDYQESQRYKTKQDGHYEGDKIRSSSYYKHSSSGQYNDRDTTSYNKYSKQYKDNQKEIQQRSYSRDIRPYKQHEDRYDKNYESRYEKRSRSRSKNRDYHHGQQMRDYSKKSGPYESKTHRYQSYSNYDRHQKHVGQNSYKNIEIDFHHKNERKYQINYPINIESIIQKKDEKNEPINYKNYSRERYQGENYRRNQSKIYLKETQKYQTKQQNDKNQKRDQQQKNFISIQVKSRQRSPNPRDKKSKKSHSSQSKSLSKSRRSKQNSKRKHNKKYRSSSSSSHSSSYSSSQSSSSSNRSSSSSSRSSSSSYSQSVESRRKKNKEHKDFYNRNSSQQKYPTQNYSNREKYDEKYPNKKSYEHSNLIIDQGKSGQRKYQKNQRQISIKSSKVQSFLTSEQKLNEERKKSIIYEQKGLKKSQVDISQSQKAKIQRENIVKAERQSLPLSDYLVQHQASHQRTFQERDSYRKFPAYNRLPYQSHHHNYQNMRQFSNYNEHQNQNQQSNVNQQTQISQSSINQGNVELNIPSYPNRTYSTQNPKVGLTGENDYQKRNFINQSFRKPYLNTYQNYPPPPATNFSQKPYQNSFNNVPYQRYSQGFAPQRPYQKNYDQNRNYDTQQLNLPATNTFNNTQNQFLNQAQMPYQSNFQPQMRRVNSEMTVERKSSYFQTVTQNKENQLKTQINKLQTQKQDLALIQQAFKRQSDLKKIKQLIPCSKVLQLIQNARQNLSIPAIKKNFLLLDSFKEMNEFRKQTMNSNLRSILQQDFENKYNQQKSKVFQNLRLLNLDQNQPKQNQQNIEQKQTNQQVFEESKHNTDKMDVQSNQNPQQVKKPNQFIWKKQQMSQNLRQLKSNIQMLRKASFSLSQLSRKIKIKEINN